MITRQVLTISNVRAILSTIALSEGCEGSDGYRTIVGSTKAKPILFTSFTDHPRQAVFINKVIGYSDAAGRYQIMSKTWDDLVNKYGRVLLPDFSPPSQDMAAALLISERNALNNICEGDFDITIEKCCPEWASFPDPAKGGASHYGGQASKPIDVLRAAYIKYGGTINQTA